MSQTLQESRDNYSAGYYEKNLEKGLYFQDVVTSALYQRGIVVVAYSSRAYQLSHGENMLGAEIKCDMNFRKTGNLYIETAEKSHPDKASYVPSGIHRKDNSWLYVIGDEKTVYIFSTKYLQMLENRYRKVETPTSKAFLLPIDEAEKYSIRKIDL
jgi:hypothetical protein